MLRERTLKIKYRKLENMQIGQKKTTGQKMKKERNRGRETDRKPNISQIQKQANTAFTQKDAEDVTIREFCTVSSFPKSRVTCANSWNRLERSIQSSGWTIHTTIGIKYRRLFPAINADILWQAYMRNIRMTSWM